MQRVDVHRITFNLTWLMTLIRGTLSTLSFWGGVGQWARQWFSSFLDPFWVDPYYFRRSYRNKIWGGLVFGHKLAVIWSKSIGSDLIN